MTSAIPGWLTSTLGVSSPTIVASMPSQNWSWGRTGGSSGSGPSCAKAAPAGSIAAVASTASVRASLLLDIAASPFVGLVSGRRV